jgi:hypothetical protein
MDMNEHSLGVDISDLNAQRFLETEPTGVDCRKESVVMEGFDMSQKLKDFGLAQNTAQPSFLLGPQNAEKLPIALKDKLKVELDARAADAQSFRRPLGSVAAKEKEILKLPLADLSRSFLVVID